MLKIPESRPRTKTSQNRASAGLLADGTRSYHVYIMCVYIYIYVCMYIYIYIYIYRERYIDR